MPSRPISRASAILVMSPRFPRFQSVMPIRSGSGAARGVRARVTDGGNRREKRRLCDEFPSARSACVAPLFPPATFSPEPRAPIASSSRAAPAPRTLPEFGVSRGGMPGNEWVCVVARAAAQKTTYWRPSLRRPPESLRRRHRLASSTAPCRYRRRARGSSRSRVPVKISPPAVTTGPTFGKCAPVFVMPFAASSGTSPSGICHVIVPAFRS